MSNRTWLQNNLLIWTSLGISALAGILFYALSGAPFGSLFRASFFVSAAGLMAVLALLSFRVVSRSGLPAKLAGYLLAFFAVLGLGLAGVVAVDYRLLLPDPLRNLSREEWRQDVAYLAEEMPRRHPAFHAKIPPHVFEETVAHLQEQIPVLTSPQIIAKLVKLVALLQEGHSAVQAMLPPANFSLYPLKTYFFDDGLFVTGASREFEKIIGMRVVKIGTKTTEEVFNAFKKILAVRTNSSSKRNFPCGA